MESKRATQPSKAPRNAGEVAPAMSAAPKHPVSKAQGGPSGTVGDSGITTKTDAEQKDAIAGAAGPASNEDTNLYEAEREALERMSEKGVDLGVVDTREHIYGEEKVEWLCKWWASMSPTAYYEQVERDMFGELE